MKVCHFIASKGLGRGEAYIDLVNALCESVEIVLLVPQGALFLPRVDKRICIFEYHSRDNRSNPCLYLELYSQLKKIKPDIVHTHFAKATQIFNRLNKFLNIPWVSTKHNPRKGRVFNKVEHVIAVSEGVAESINHDRVKVIHNGISAVDIPDEAHLAVQENKQFTILAVGRLEKVKAFDRLIEECAKLKFDFKLLLAGDGPEKSNLSALTNSMNLNGKVDILGYRSDIPKLMRQADVVVVCSHSEGFSLVILEALCYGKVLVSRAVGIAGNLLSEMFLIQKYEIAAKLDEVFHNYGYFESEFKVIKESKMSEYLIQNSSDQHIEYYRNILSKK